MLNITEIHLMVLDSTDSIRRLPNGQFASHSYPAFADLAWVQLQKKCPYDTAGRTYLEYMIAQAIDDAVDTNPKYRFPGREFVANRVWGKPVEYHESTLDTNITITRVTVNLMGVPAVEAIDTTCRVLPNDVVQPSITSETPKLASE